ncbi:hypothetical protein BpHYR1_010264 [Brachionus plicatilis]|uniref:Uncharacterized protein n=1 Tax=Brachionus plicatilis TaxID=10195 RepID=A0A3M7SMV9_BRAPC|nr:hypothetical protein BpHYR1_010264 [Brachionus plicatilis]
MSCGDEFELHPIKFDINLFFFEIILEKNISTNKIKADLFLSHKSQVKSSQSLNKSIFDTNKLVASKFLAVNLALSGLLICPDAAGIDKNFCASHNLTNVNIFNITIMRIV